MLPPKALCLLASLHVSYVSASIKLSKVLYCPFEVKTAPSDDPKSFDITYTPTDKPINTYMFDGKACLIAIDFSTPDERGDVFLEEIEYQGNTKMSAETKVAWSENHGPVSTYLFANVIPGVQR